MSRRITWSIVGVVVASLLLVGTATLVFARVSNRAQALRVLERQAGSAVTLLPAGGLAGTQLGGTDPTPAQTARRDVVKALNLTGVGEVIITARGRVLGTLPTGVPDNALDPAALGQGSVQSGVHGNTLWAAAARPEVGAAGRTRLAVTVITQKQERFFGPTFRWFALFAAISVVIAAAVATVLGRRLAGPVHAAVVTTRRIADGDLSARLTPPPGARPDDELSVLADSINSMATGLGRARDQERSFLLSVSHDLRTPMTSIRGYAEAIVDGATDDPRRAAGVILSESRRLERLIGDLLDLARLDADRFALDLTVADLADIAAGTADGFGPELRDAGLTLVAQLEEHAATLARVDVDRFAQLIANLLTNAVSFARTTVVIRVTRQGPDVVVEVSDDGPGISTDQLPHVFERLYQADNQRDRRGAGSGLGLAIVAELVNRMDGRLDVTSSVGTGTTFAIRIAAA